MHKLIAALAVVVALVACSGGGTENETVITPGPSAVGGESAAGGASDSANDAGDPGGSSSGAGSSGGDSDSGDSDSGSNGGTDGDGSGDTGDGGSSACTDTGVGLAFERVSATSIDDPALPPAHLIDGCTTRAAMWSGKRGTIVTLDAGSVHQMQGIYLWSGYARMEFLKIETAGADQNFHTDYHAVPTKPVSGAVYYPFEQPGGVRYVRINGYGSDVNDWSNLAEVRWSSTGWKVTGERVWRTKPGFADFDRFLTYNVDDRMVMVSRAYSQVLWHRTGRLCEQLRRDLVVLDATGEQSEFWGYRDVNGSPLYVIDWDHWDGVAHDLTGPAQLWEISTDYLRRFGPFPPDDELCERAVGGDPEYNVGAAYSDAQSELPPFPLSDYY